MLQTAYYCVEEFIKLKDDAKIKFQLKDGLGEVLAPIEYSKVDLLKQVGNKDVVRGDDAKDYCNLHLTSPKKNFFKS